MKNLRTIKAYVNCLVLFGLFFNQYGHSQPEPPGNENNLSSNGKADFDGYFIEGSNKPGFQEDLTFLYTNLCQNHPRPYAYVTRDSLETLYSSLMEKIQTDQTKEDFYLLASRLTDAIHCGHTGVRFGESHRHSVFELGNFFPLQLFFRDGRAYYISGDVFRGRSLPRGCEIISINNLGIEEIISQIMYLIPADGNGYTAKYNSLNRHFNTLFYHVDPSEEFRIEYTTGSSILNITLQACKYSALSCMPASKLQKEHVDFEYLHDQSLGILRVRTFAIRDMDVYFRQLDSVFSIIVYNQTNNLVLDLRDNPGGHPIFAAQLFSYLTDRDFTYFKTNNEFMEFEPLYKPMAPNPIGFEGDLYVFVNGGCLSTTGHLISLLKAYTDAVFIGEQPGSTFLCNDFAIRLTLPNSGIVLNVPRATFETSVSDLNSAHPFQVDYMANQTVDHVLSRRDIYQEIIFTKLSSYENTK